MIDAVTREANYLDAMWAAKYQPESVRWAIVQSLSRIVIERPDDWDYYALRAADLPHDLEPWCFICGDDSRSLHQHHVIQLQHGGSNTRRNIVNLCYRHHAALHPWMPAVSCRARGWMSIADMATVAREVYLR